MRATLTATAEFKAADGYGGFIVEEQDLEFEVEYTPGTRAVLTGNPDNWEPEENPEIEIIAIRGDDGSLWDEDCITNIEKVKEVLLIEAGEELEERKWDYTI